MFLSIYFFIFLCEKIMMIDDEKDGSNIDILREKVR